MEISKNSLIFRFIAFYEDERHLQWRADNKRLTLCDVANSFFKWVAIVALTTFFVVNLINGMLFVAYDVFRFLHVNVIDAMKGSPYEFFISATTVFGLLGYSLIAVLGIFYLKDAYQKAYQNHSTETQSVIRTYIRSKLDRYCVLVTLK